MKHVQTLIACGLVWLALISATPALAQEQESAPQVREHRLPCDGVVSLYYGDELLWRKDPEDIRKLQGLVPVPREQGKTGMTLQSLLELRPGVVAIELESCQPRLRRFERAEIESKAGAALYLVATRYRGFKLKNTTGKGRRTGGGGGGGGGAGGGMKNIGKIVLVPSVDPDSGISAAD